MLANIRSRDDNLCLADIIVLDKDNLKEVADVLVLIDDGPHIVDQVNDLLGHPVPRRSLPANDRHARLLLLPLVGRHSLEGDVPVDDAKDVELLALVLVDPLHLDVKQGRGVDGDAPRFLDELRKADLVGVLDLRPLLAESLVFEAKLQLVNLRQVLEEVLAAALGRNKLGQAGVGLVEPSAWGDSVRDIGELVDPKDGDKVLENGRLDEVGVELGDAVDLVRANNSEVRHANHLRLRLLDDGDSPKHVSVIRECLLNTLEEEQINVVYNLEMSREQVLYEAHGPLLERFREDRVVGVPELLRVS